MGAGKWTEGGNFPGGEEELWEGKLRLWKLRTPPPPRALPAARLPHHSPVPLCSGFTRAPARPARHLRASLTRSTEPRTTSDTLCRSSAAVPGLLSARVNFRVSADAGCGCCAILRPPPRAPERAVPPGRAAARCAPGTGTRVPAGSSGAAAQATPSVPRHAPRCPPRAPVPAAAPRLTRYDLECSARCGSPMPPTSASGRLLGAGCPAGWGGAERGGAGRGGASGKGGNPGTAPEGTEPERLQAGPRRNCGGLTEPLRVRARWHHDALDLASSKVVCVYVTRRRHKSSPWRP